MFTMMGERKMFTKVGEREMFTRVGERKMGFHDVAFLPV